MIPREQRTRKERPCPACGHTTGWCFFLQGNDAVWCGRESRFAGKDGRAHKSGWIHQLVDRPREETPRPRRIAPPKVRKFFDEQAERFAAAMTPGMYKRLADQLGVNVTSLRKLSVGWAEAWQIRALETKCQGTGCWTFPMKDANDRVVGIRLRSLPSPEHPEGFKYGLMHQDGSGLFVPAGINGHCGQILAPEGPTSLAALLTMKFDAVGRPNCRAGIEYLRQLIGRLKPSRFVVIGDNDKPDSHGRRAGQESAPVVAAAVADLCPDVRVLIPPEGIKDGRKWLHAGGTHDEVQAEIERAGRRRWRHAG